MQVVVVRYFQFTYIYTNSSLVYILFPSLHLLIVLPVALQHLARPSMIFHRSRVVSVYVSAVDQLLQSLD